MASKPKSTRAAGTRAAGTKATSARAASRSGAGRRLGSPYRPLQAAKTFTSKPVDIAFAGPEHRFERADLEILGIFHGEASYEGRIFLNNPQADADTPETIENGFAGSFNIFGHGGCTGDPGHCELNGSRAGPYDLRNPHPLTPAKKRVNVTEALKSVALTAKETTVTIVPVVTAANEFCETGDVFRCEGLRFVSYNG